jgi:hypothetical protein
MIPEYLGLPSAALLTGATARRFLTDEHDFINGVLLRDISGFERTLHARVFILAAGAVESARRLLLSKSQYPNGFGNAPLFPLGYDLGQSDIEGLDRLAPSIDELAHPQFCTNKCPKRVNAFLRISVPGGSHAQLVYVFQ